MARCFVMQPFDGAEFDRRYNEIYREAIEAAGFEPYRVDSDPSASVPIHTIETEIKASAACFADISVDNPNVWFELGYAISAGKPVCLVCSSARQKFPFDVQHRKIIRYRSESPSDFQRLSNEIRERLLWISEKEVSLERIASSNLPPAGDEAVKTRLDDIAFAALCIIFENDEDGEIGPSRYIISNMMERIGYTGIATRIALQELVQMQLAVQKTAYDERGDAYLAYVVTTGGQEYIIRNRDRIQLRIDRSRAPGISF